MKKWSVVLLAVLCFCWLTLPVLAGDPEVLGGLLKANPDYPGWCFKYFYGGKGKSIFPHYPKKALFLVKPGQRIAGQGDQGEWELLVTAFRQPLYVLRQTFGGIKISLVANSKDLIAEIFVPDGGRVVVGVPEGYYLAIKLVEMRGTYPNQEALLEISAAE